MPKSEKKKMKIEKSFYSNNKITVKKNVWVIF